MLTTMNLLSLILINSIAVISEGASGILIKRIN